MFWSQFQIKDQDASFRWETYDKLDRDGNTVSTLLDPRTESFKKLKIIIEEKVIILFIYCIYHDYSSLMTCSPPPPRVSGQVL